jgi:hypothetical protein
MDFLKNFSMKVRLTRTSAVTGILAAPFLLLASCGHDRMVSKTSQTYLDRLRATNQNQLAHAFQDAISAYDRRDIAAGDQIRNSHFCENARALSKVGGDAESGSLLTEGCEHLVNYSKSLSKTNATNNDQITRSVSFPSFDENEKGILVVGASRLAVESAFPRATYSTTLGGKVRVSVYRFDKRVVHVLCREQEVIAFVSIMTPTLDLIASDKLAVIRGFDSTQVGDRQIYERSTELGRSFYVLHRQRYLLIDAAARTTVDVLVRQAITKSLADNDYSIEIWRSE